MVRRLTLITIAVSILICFPLGTWGMSGKVIDHTGKPISGATVMVMDGGVPGLQDFEANDKGEFTMTDDDFGVPPGFATTAMFAMLIRVLDSNSEPVPNARVSLAAGRAEAAATLQTDENGNFAYSRSPETAVCTTRIYDSSGQPVPHSRLTFQTPMFPEASSLIMNERGENTQEIASESDGQVEFVALAEGYSYAVASYDGDEPLTLTLWPETIVSGKVVDEAGEPVAGVRIAVESLSGDDASGNDLFINMWSLPNTNNWTVISASDGSFSLRNVVDPTSLRYYQLTLELAADGYANEQMYLSKEQLAKPLVVTLPTETKVTGVLYLPGKNDLAPAGTAISYCLARQGEMLSSKTRVGQNGEFSFSKLKAGRLMLIASSDESAHTDEQTQETDRWIVAPVVIDLAAGQTTHVELVATRAALLQGVAVDKRTGKPIANGRLSLVNTGMSSMGDYRTNEMGEFSLQVPAGEAVIYLCGIGDQHDNYAYFGDDVFSPTAEFSVEEGHTLSGLTLAFDLRHVMPKSLDDVQIPEDFELKAASYELTWDQELRFIDSWNHPLDGEIIRAQISKLPQLVTHNPYYAAFKIDGSDGDGLLLAVLDESKGTGTGYDTIYIDTNRNKDLSDDARMSRQLNPYRTMFPWTSVMSRQGTGPDQTANPMMIRIYSHSYNLPDLRLARKGGWITQVDSTKGKVELALIDRNNNGVYGDLAPVTDDWPYHSDVDYAYIDTTGYGYAATHLSGPHEAALYDVTKIGNRYYRFQSNQTGNKITIAPYEGETGQLKILGGPINGLETRACSAVAISEHGVYDLDDLARNAARLPVGVYRLRCLVEIPRSSEDDTDKVTAICILTEPNIVIEDDRQTEVTISGDIICSIDGDKAETVLTAGRRDQPVKWTTSLGNFGRISSICGNQDDAYPKAEFFDNEGRLLRESCLGSSCDGYTIDVPEIEPGTYTLRVSLDAGPRLGVLSAERQVRIVAPTASQ